MKRLGIFCTALALTACGTTAPPTGQLQTISPAAAYNYFEEIAFDSEWDGKHNVKKWTQGMYVYVDAPAGVPEYLASELDVIVDELNELVGWGELPGYEMIKFVDNREAANMTIYMGAPQGFIQLEPSSASRITGPGANSGYFIVHSWRSSSRIYAGSIFLNMVDPKLTDNAKKHLLREELTQSLGLMNDSVKYSRSMFYAGWTLRTNFTTLDKRLIRTLYNPDVQPGMTKSQVRRVTRGSVL